MPCGGYYKKTPHFSHFISITVNLFSATAILYVSAPYSTIGITATPYNLLLTFNLIALQLNTFIFPNTLLTLLILDLTCLFLNLQ